MLGIISDVHGNYPALSAVLNELDAMGCENIVSLGDVAGYYCMINECIEELRERSVVNILGNHDFYIINNQKCERSYTVNQCLEYQKRILKNENLDWLKESVPYIKEKDWWMVHGGWNNYLDEYICEFDFLNHPNEEIELFISGHTHIQKMVRGEIATYVNPGAVGQPRDGIPKAAYAVINNGGHVQLFRTEYDIDRIFFEMKKAGFQDRITACLYEGLRIGESR